MALCESQLDSVPGISGDSKPDEEGSSSSPRSEGSQQSPAAGSQPANDVVEQGPPGLVLSSGLPLTVDYRSPVSHFIPPAVFTRQREEYEEAHTSLTPSPPKRPRGRPRVDKTSPEYLANMAAKKQAREMAAMMSRNTETPPGEKRKRGRPRVDKTSPEYLARKREREQEAFEKKAKREYRRRAGEKPGEPPIIRIENSSVITIIPSDSSSGTSNTSKETLSSPEQVSNTKESVSLQPVRVSKRIPARNGKVARNIATAFTTRNVKRNVKNGATRKVQKNGSTKNGAVKKNATKLVNKNGIRKTIKSNAARKPVNSRPQKVTKIRTNVTDKKNVVRRRSEIVKSEEADTNPDGTPRVKRKYTKRQPGVKKETPEKVKGKRGRPRKAEQLARTPGPSGVIRVRSNLMPANNVTINLDSDEEPDLGSPSQASDSLSLDENLKALRHIHEKYANIDKDDMYGSHLLAANSKKPHHQRLGDDDEVLSIRSSEGTTSVKADRVEKLEDSSNSDSDSSSSGSSSSGSSSSSSSDSSSSDSSDSESDDDKPKTDINNGTANNGPTEDDRSFGAWSYSNNQSDSESDPERNGEPTPPAILDEISESENESADKSFQCHICRKWYSTRVTLKIHRRGHQNRGGNGTSRSRTRSSDRYECDCCNETFNRREKLWEHRAQVHRGAMTVRCEVCRKCFEDDTELAIHDRMHTADEREGRCSDCGLMFPRFDQLRRHRACAHGAASAATGSNLPHACQQCGKRFGHAHSLTRHMQNHQKQLYRCVVCKASFARADQLAQHLNSHLANYKRLKP